MIPTRDLSRLITGKQFFCTNNPKPLRHIFGGIDPAGHHIHEREKMKTLIFWFSKNLAIIIFATEIVVGIAAAITDFFENDRWC